jgi:hypothetical protein
MKMACGADPLVRSRPPGRLSRADQGVRPTTYTEAVQ